MHNLMVNLTEQERQLLDKVAKEKTLGTSTFVRMVAVETAKSIILNTYEVEQEQE
jgi:uncharacterized protein (DUF1778 family)